MVTDMFWQYVSTDIVGIVNSCERPQLMSKGSSQLFAPVVQVQCTAINFDTVKNEFSVSYKTDLLSSPFLGEFL